MRAQYYNNKTYKMFPILSSTNQNINTPYHQQNTNKQVFIQQSRLYPRPSPYLQENLYKFAKGPSKTLLPVINEIQIEYNNPKLSAEQYFNSNTYIVSNLNPSIMATNDKHYGQHAFKKQIEQQKQIHKEQIISMKCYCCLRVIQKEGQIDNFLNNFGKNTYPSSNHKSNGFNQNMNNNNEHNTEQRQSQMQDQSQNAQKVNKLSSQHNESKSKNRQHQLLLFKKGIAPPEQLQQNQKMLHQEGMWIQGEEEVHRIDDLGNNRNTLMNYFRKNNQQNREMNQERNNQANIDIQGHSEKQNDIQMQILNNLNMRKCYECSKFVCPECVRLCMKCRRAICRFDYQNQNQRKITGHQCF